MRPSAAYTSLVAFSLNATALSRAVRVGRRERRVTLSTLADELGIDPDELKAIEAGRDAHVGSVLQVVAWLNVPFSTFLEGEVDSDRVDPGLRAERVAAYLRSDRDLKPESAEAIEQVLKAAYDRFAAA